MTSVNRDHHVADLLGAAFGQLRAELVGRGPAGLRPSHFRVIDAIPADGVSVTDLAALLGMTKQGCGQFVTMLTERGFVETATSARDRRVRWVRRTPAGDAIRREMREWLTDVESVWSERVGAQRYGVFRAVLEELAGDAPG